MRYYYKIERLNGSYFYTRSKEPIRNLKDATRKTKQPIISITPSGLIPYLFDCIKSRKKPLVITNKTTL